MSRQPQHYAVSLVKAEAAAPSAAPTAAPEAEGALVVALRWPVRVVVLLVVAPVRMVWDALVICGRALRRTVWKPFARAMAWLGRTVGAALGWVARALFVWPWEALWRYLVAPVGRGLGAVAVWLYRWVLTPVGHGVAAVVYGVGAVLAWLGRMLLVLWRYVLVPAGRGLAWLGRVLIVIPAVAVYRYVLTPVGRVLAVLGREIADAVVFGWQLAGRISRAVFGFLGRVLRVLFVVPVVWVWRHVLAPAGRNLRDHVWRPVADVARGVGRTVRAAAASARASVRQARADIRRALFGGPRRSAVPPDDGTAEPFAPVALQKSAGR